MKNKIRVAILFGGRSAEHEISLLSAQNVIKALNKDKYEAILIGIDKTGKWYYQEESMKLLHANDPKKIQLAETVQEVLFSQNTDAKFLQSADGVTSVRDIDVLFPVLHGTYGEDGSIQGLARLANIACVGPGILGSSVGMDKEVMKRLLRDAGILIADFVTVRRAQKDKVSYKEVADKLGKELFVKPANLGSSVGISFVRKEEDFLPAIELAFQFDNKIVIEERIIGREIECAVLGNEEPIASIAGEVIPKDGFYSYESKYVDEQGAKLEVPAKLSQMELARVQKLALETFILLECHGMARVDMFMTATGQLYINEINTIPGFTNISMYPTLWKLSGISNEDLIDRLIQLALDHHEAENRLKYLV